MAEYNEKGQEIPDDTPIELPIGYNTPEPLEKMIARMIRIHSLQAVKTGLESFEEADDLEPEEDEIQSQFQVMPEDAPAQVNPPAPAPAPVAPAAALKQ